MNRTEPDSARFVIQKHRARSLHYDFRLERDGVYKSWAVPKGVPETMGIRHLAVQVPDHPLEWGSFEGTIPTKEECSKSYATSRRISPIPIDTASNVRRLASRGWVLLGR